MKDYGGFCITDIVGKVWKKHTYSGAAQMYTRSEIIYWDLGNSCGVGLIVTADLTAYTG